MHVNVFIVLCIVKSHYMGLCPYQLAHLPSVYTAAINLNGPPGDGWETFQFARLKPHQIQACLKSISNNLLSICANTTPPSCDLQGGGGNAVTFGPGAQAVPLLHRGPLGGQQSSPVGRLGGACGELSNHDAAHKVIAALHVVAVH